MKTVAIHQHRFSALVPETEFECQTLLLALRYLMFDTRGERIGTMPIICTPDSESTGWEYSTQLLFGQHITARRGSSIRQKFDDKGFLACDVHVIGHNADRSEQAEWKLVCRLRVADWHGPVLEWEMDYGDGMKPDGFMHFSDPYVLEARLRNTPRTK